MNSVNLKLARGILGALVVGALGFGATQALASPTQAGWPYGWCTEEEQTMCDNFCAPSGGRGRCTNFGVWHCECFDR